MLERKCWSEIVGISEAKMSERRFWDDGSENVGAKCIEMSQKSAISLHASEMRCVSEIAAISLKSRLVGAKLPQSRSNLAVRAT